MHLLFRDDEIWASAIYLKNDSILFMFFNEMSYFKLILSFLIFFFSAVNKKLI